MSAFISGPNAIELQWQSAATGSWEGELHLYEWRDRYVDFPGKNLFLWFYSKEGIRARSLPRMALRDLDGGFTQPLSIGAYTHDLKPGEWTRLRIPLADFTTASVQPFAPRRLAVVAFVQGTADQAQHTLFVDDIRVEDATGPTRHAPATPGNAQATAYERHIDITWDAVEDPGLAQYVIYRSTHGGPFRGHRGATPGRRSLLRFPRRPTRDRVVSRFSPHVIAPRVAALVAGHRFHPPNERR